MEKLDLHGMKHEDIRGEVIRFVEDNWNTNGAELEIVTGHGTTMKYLVRGVLDEYQLDHKTGDALGVNMGFIRVTMP